MILRPFYHSYTSLASTWFSVAHWFVSKNKSRFSYSWIENQEREFSMVTLLVTMRESHLCYISLISNSQKKEATKVFMNRWMDRQANCGLYIQWIFSSLKRMKILTCYNILAWMALEDIMLYEINQSKRQILYISTYMTYLELSHSLKQKVEQWLPGNKLAQKTNTV